MSHCIAQRRTSLSRRRCQSRPCVVLRAFSSTRLRCQSRPWVVFRAFSSTLRGIPLPTPSATPGSATPPHAMFPSSSLATGSLVGTASAGSKAPGEAGCSARLLRLLTGLQSGTARSREEDTAGGLQAWRRETLPASKRTLCKDWKAHTIALNLQP